MAKRPGGETHPHGLDGAIRRGTLWRVTSCRSIRLLFLHSAAAPSRSDLHSDGESNQVSCTSLPDVCIPETGAVQEVDLGVYFSGLTTTLLVQSAEPGTLAFLSLGLGGIAALGARRQRG